MPLDEATVQRIARLARIAVTGEEKARLARELSGILDWVEQLGEVDTEGVEPMTSVTDTLLKSREDRVTDGGMAGDILRNAPRAAHGFFTAPKTFE